jgi:hypothetical protein
MMTSRALFPSMLSLSIVSVLVAAGCSSDISHGTVSGTVTLDSGPLEKGLIRFVPADGQTATADATIENGAFTARVPVGEKRVSISAPKVGGKRKMYETADSPIVDVVHELLPDRYNVRSELTYTVQPGKQQQDFVLSSGK